MDPVVAATIAIFIAGVVYAAGRLSARVDSLEQWRREQTDALNAIHAAIRRLELLIKNGET